MEEQEYLCMEETELVRRAILRERLAVQTITILNNQRMFRAAWSVLRNHADAEDVVQEAYLKAFTSLETFTGQSQLSTWLTRIVVNTALDRQRANNRRRTDLLSQDVAMLDEYRARFSQQEALSPEKELLRSELSRILKGLIAQLPDEFRSVFVLREIEGMTTRETADALDLKEATVKTRLLRARRHLRKMLEPDVRSVFSDTIPFAGADCEAMTGRVLSALKINH